MALRTVEPERRARTASETSKGRRRYARWGILLAHSNLSPTAMASARSQRVSLAETSKAMSGEQLSRRARGLQRARRRRNWRCRWRSKSGTTFTLMWDTFCARAVAKCVAFPGGVARAPAEIVVLPAYLYREKTVGAAASARATSKCSPRSRARRKCPVCPEKIISDLELLRGRVGQEFPERWLSREHAFSGADRGYSGELSTQFPRKPTREAFPTVPRASFASRASFWSPVPHRIGIVSP